jgi:dTDP-glucose 4,6-dehydratase
MSQIIYDESGFAVGKVWDKKRILITGGAGFIASHVIDLILKTTDWEIIVLDKFTYASNGLTRLKEIGAYDNPRVELHVADVSRPLGACLENEIGIVDYFLHMAAGTHVDNSIKCPRDFVEANTFGTLEMLEYARRIPLLKKFVYFSTDEVFGPAAIGQKFLEWDRYNSCNPYSATKAGGEELALAWENTYNVPVIITHTMNVIGERQHPEKFLPRVVRSILKGTELQIHTDPKTGLPGSRNYLHCRDVADGVMFLLEHGKTREKYNIASGDDISNLTVAKMVAEILQQPLIYRKVNPVSVRPGFDVRYGLSHEKMKAMGWVAKHSFEENLRSLVEWMVAPENLHWLEL